ncbi:MAG: T9SS type A sorting domain-containing protein, partial [Flavobacteriales bacterium]
TATVSVGTQVSVNEVGANFISIFPNPTNGMITIQTTVNYGFIVVRDALGREISTLQINASSLNIDLITQANGIYFVELHTAQGITTQRVVLAK